MTDAVRKPDWKDRIFLGVDWIWQRLKGLAWLYHPRTLREKGVIWASLLLLVTAVVVLWGIGIYWSQEPEPFDVRTAALEMAGGDQEKLVPGYVTTATLTHEAEVLLDKPGGYLSNDVMPPSSLFGLTPLLDNMPNWEFGAVVMLRDTARVLRNDFSRSQSQSREDRDLAEAEPRLNFSNDSWMFPPTERQYRKATLHLRNYLRRLADPQDHSAQFYTRADNLNQLLWVAGKRLGSLSQRLNASVAEERINVDLAGDPSARQSTPTPRTVRAETPWLEIDDVYYEARGYTWALLHILQAVEIDFADVLKKKNATASLQQVVRLLEQTQVDAASPIVLNGDPMGWVANYSKTMVSYISPANAALIDLRNLLTQG